MVKFVAAASLAAGAALFIQGIDSFNFDMNAYMKIQAMKNKFNADRLDKDQQSALMQVAGFGDMDLFLSKHLTPAEFKQSLKQEMKDRMVSDLLNGGGIDISNPLWRRQFFKDKNNAELLTETMPEPMRSIVRLTRDANPDNKEYGKKLLKKFQYKKFNKEGNYFTENMDEILLADNKAAKIKELLKRQMLQSIADPIDRAMMYNLQQQQATGDSAEKAKLRADMKDFQTIKVFQSSVPKVSPVSADDLYAFHELTNVDDPNESEILSVALGDPLKGISELDFERYFGGPAKQFACRAHPNRLRVPCGINPSADECAASGCCFIPTGDDQVPQCYHDLYGKIGSGLLRNEFVQSNDGVKDQIKGLFRGGQIPSISRILKEDYESLVQRPAEGGAVHEYENHNWWDAAKVPGEDGTSTRLTSQEDNTRYGRPGFAWKPHGPTASPYLAANPLVNPTAAPGGGGLDGYYQMWLAYTDTQDQAQCALINTNSRVKCMDNFDALVDHNLNPTNSKCKQAGCCFNEASFLGGSHACYRASDYGTCVNLPSNFVKRDCGFEGITEGECLTNPRCCFDDKTPPPNSNSPWCYYKYSATLDEEEWCTAWNLKENRRKPRSMCWDTQTSTSGLFQSDGGVDTMVSNINNLVSKEQCEQAGCCFDENLTTDALDWIIKGLGQGAGQYRCFKKENPAIKWANDGDSFQVNKEINWSKDGDGNDLADQSTYSEGGQKTCDSDKWKEFTFKKTCGENLSYYQCVYVNRCCYKATVINEPKCYKPQ